MQLYKDTIKGERPQDKNIPRKTKHSRLNKILFGREEYIHSVFLGLLGKGKEEPVLRAWKSVERLQSEKTLQHHILIVVLYL